MRRRRIALATVTFASAAVVLAGPASARWLPRPTTTAWQWQLQGRIDTSVRAKVYEVDGFDTGARLVRRLHRGGRRAICYLDVGSWESYRPDAAAFPRRFFATPTRATPTDAGPHTPASTR